MRTCNDGGGELAEAMDEPLWLSLLRVLPYRQSGQGQHEKVIESLSMPSL